MLATSHTVCCVEVLEDVATHFMCLPCGKLCNCCGQWSREAFSGYGGSVWYTGWTAQGDVEGWFNKIEK